MQILYFTAEWCQPCAKFKPVVEQIASEYRIPVEYVDIDSPEGSAHAQRMSILGVPTVAFMEGPEELVRVGTSTKGQLREVVNRLVDDQAA